MAMRTLPGITSSTSIPRCCEARSPPNMASTDESAISTAAIFNGR
jgi:hypothetical protein